ncbi:aminotransferase class I/II-fold pyridoxal phosphate-dependent enzyme [Shewanella sp. GXUN23E]|uniref:aminotransferase class I/II-fold pyridoxal phosphate-dependent enzyme n=1 Tax=Shewanella sp. GXUN23E TaxID=3422498 RepID=UPI003D7D0037
MNHRSKLAQRLGEGLAAQQQAGLLRTRQVQPQSLLDFAGNDYLGLASSQVLNTLAAEALTEVACGSGASPLVSGYCRTHQALEAKLCQRTGHEAALLFCSGFSANQALMKTLFSDADTVLADKLVHASIIDGLKDSGARLRRFLHNDAASAAAMAQKQSVTALITESVFSMDGDCAPLSQLRQLCDEQNAWLIVDDAHGFAIPRDDGGACDSQFADVQLVTFGKALGCQGAALLGSQLFVDYMVANCRHYIYSTALSPLAAQLALSALSLVDTPIRQQPLLDNIRLFRALCQQAGLSLLPSDTPIQPLLVGDNDTVMALAAALRQRGILVGAIRPPTVPVGSARLRITLSARHSRQDIEYLVSVLGELLPPQSQVEPQI